MCFSAVHFFSVPRWAFANGGLSKLFLWWISLYFFVYSSELIAQVAAGDFTTLGSISM
jgi:hypothetical protein